MNGREGDGYIREHFDHVLSLRDAWNADRGADRERARIVAIIKSHSCLAEGDGDKPGSAALYYVLKELEKGGT